MRNLIATSALSALAASAPSIDRNAWTFMVYGAANNSCEETLLHDVAAMRRGLVGARDVEVVLFIDRMRGFSDDDDALGEDFVDSRLYRLADGVCERLDGAPHFPEITKDGEHDANQGDGETLRKFVRFAKAFRPAERYALVFYSHGDGRAMAFDVDSENDELFVAEVTEALEERDSVDLLVFDVCSMGGVENAYQWRPRPGEFGAKAMVASASVSAPLPYAAILGRLRAGDGAGPNALDPRAATTLAIGGAIVDEIAASRRRYGANSPLDFESWACLDLTRAEGAKRELDQLARALAQANAKEIAERLRGSDGDVRAMHYMVDGEPCWTSMPYFDAYDVANRLANCEELPAAARDRAKAAMSAIDELVAASIAFARYPTFAPGKHGVFVLFPDGDASHREGPDWAQFRWYQPSDARKHPRAFGKLAFCADGSTADDGRVETWFELLDSWFDADARCNDYRW